MNIENYQYFVAAAEELNFTKAANRLYMTQQALSKHIDKMEKFYNVRLFNREAPMSLTPAGECLYRNMCQVLNAERQMRLELDDFLEKSNRNLTVGISYYKSGLFMPRILKEFSEIHPEVCVHVKEKNLLANLEELRLGKMDLLMGYEMPENSIYSSYPLYTERVVLVISREIAHKYFSDQEIDEFQESQCIPLERFQECPFIKMDSFTWMGKVLDKYWEEKHLTPNVVVNSSSIITVLNCCVEGMGATLIPAFYLRNLAEEQREKIYVFCWDYPDVTSEGAILCLKSSYISTVIKDFIKIAQRVGVEYEAQIQRDLEL